MKHKNLLFLLTTLTLSSCITPSISSTPSESEPLSTSESVSSSEVKESTEESSSNEESNQESPTPEDSSTTDSSPIEEENDAFTQVTDFLGSDGDVYRINIKTNEGEFPLDKETYVKGNINITEQDTSKVIKEDMPMGIKLRFKTKFIWFRKS